MKNCPQCGQPARLFWSKRGPTCLSCSQGSRLAPSERQLRLFSRGFVGASLAQILLLPVGSPLLLLYAFCVALLKRIEGAWQMLPGLVSLLLLWALLFPPLIQDPDGGSGAVVAGFLLLAFFLQLPFLLVSRNMLLRGHGIIAGITLSSASLSLLLSLLLLLLLLLL